MSRLRAVGLTAATVLAGLTVLLDEVVLWAGQPTGDPTAAHVAAWYDAHGGRVLLGDALWLVACGVLVAALWTAAAHFPSAPRWAVRLVGLSATTALAASSLFAARIALGVVDDPLEAWRQEGAAYRFGAALLALALVPILEDLASSGRRVLMAVSALVIPALVWPATAGFALVAGFVVVGLVLAAPRSAPVEDATPDGSTSLRQPPQTDAAAHCR